MELINQHFENYLEDFISQQDNSFDELFAFVYNELKHECEPILKYLHNLLCTLTSEGTEKIEVLHLHFQDDYNERELALVAEYVVLYFFRLYHFNNSKSTVINQAILQLKESLHTQRKRLAQCPADASASKGGNKSYKKWQTQKRHIKDLIEFYEAFNETSSITLKTLFNCSVKTSHKLLDTFKSKPYAISLDSFQKIQTYCIVNSEVGINELDKNENLVDNLEAVILFDCERKRIMSNFSLEELNKWNTDYETQFKQYFILTFGNDSLALQNLRNKIDTIREKFKIAPDTSYTILSQELDILLKRNKKNEVLTEFTGLVNSSIWDIFLLETNIRELYELRSIKMMNIYSICFTAEIKKYILDDIFSDNENVKLISYNTKQAIIQLRPDDLDLLRNSLEKTLDLIMQSDLKAKIQNSISNKTVIITDELIIKDLTLKSKLIDVLKLERSNKLVDWASIDGSIEKPTLIISYRDQGRFPNNFYPNVIDSTYFTNPKTSSIFINFFFRHQYDWSKYYLMRDTNKYLNHPVRQQHFGWKDLKQAIEETRPKSKVNIDWTLEYEYSTSDNRETYKIKLRGQKAKTYRNSDLFIVKNIEDSNYRVEKITSLLTLNINDQLYQIQNLEEIQELTNIFSKILDTKQHEEELKIIRNQFDLADESAGKLWKLLLKKQCILKGEEIFYDELKSYLESKKMRMVSFLHFKTTWINPDSESISPISNRVFIELCVFLKIDRIYYIIMQRIKNASRQSSRQSTRQMNQLLRDLFNDGCFNNGFSAKEIISDKISFYKKNHPMDELGIDENNLLDNLVTLTELIQPELNPLAIEYIEKIEQ